MKSALPAQKDGPRINEEIRSKEVQLIDSTGDNKGVVDYQTAMSMAEAAGLDLVEISPNTTPRSARSWISANTNSRRRRKPLKPAKNKKSSRSRRSSSVR